MPPQQRRTYRLDPTPDTFRLLWDAIHDLNAKLTAASTTATTQASALASLQSQITSTRRLAQQAAVSAGQPVTPAAVGAPPPNVTGPIIPDPGTPAPVPPNEAPLTGTLGAGDAIPIGAITWEASVNPAAWPITASLTGVDWSVAGLGLTHTKQTGVGRWPDQPFGTGSIQYTVWAVLQIAGIYYGGAGIMYWFGLDRNGGPPSGFTHNWFYSSATWGPLANVVPAFNSPVYLFVTAGATRTNGVSAVLERSQIVQIGMPSNAGGVFTL